MIVLEDLVVAAGLAAGLGHRRFESRAAEAVRGPTGGADVGAASHSLGILHAHGLYSFFPDSHERSLRPGWIIATSWGGCCCPESSSAVLPHSIPWPSGRQSRAPTLPYGAAIAVVVRLVLGKTSYMKPVDRRELRPRCSNLRRPSSSSSRHCGNSGDRAVTVAASQPKATPGPSAEPAGGVEGDAAGVQRHELTPIEVSRY